MANPKGNPQNLKSLATRTLEERREISKKGRIARRKKAAERKLLKERMREYVSMRVTDSKEKAELTAAGFGKSPTNGDKLCYEVIKKAGQNANMARLVMELLGEMDAPSVLINNINEQNTARVVVYLPDNGRN